MFSINFLIYFDENPVILWTLDSEEGGVTVKNERAKNT